MKLKRYGTSMLCAGILLCALGLILPFIVLQNHSGTGIIGGADAPTYEFLILHSMNGLPLCLMTFGIALIFSALFCLIFTKTLKANCSIKTTIISLGLSCVGAMGLVCVFTWFVIVAFNETARYPIAYPVSIILGFVSFIAFLLLAALYLKERRKNWAVKGLIIDVLTSVIYLPSFFLLLACLLDFIR